MFSVEIEHDLEKATSFAEGVENQLTDPDLSHASKSAVEEFQSLLRGGKFVPLAASTREIRSRRGRGGTTPLSESGALERSVSAKHRKAEFTVSSDLAKSGFLRSGGVTSDSSAIPGKNVPGRDFMKVSDKLLNTVAKSVLDRLRG